jgi:REP element-mobilizing transposase RayT
MSRKPRIHFPGAVYHVILRGNGGQDIFFSKKDRSKFYLLLQEGIEKFGHRILAFCLMSNPVHLVIQVGEKPLSRIMQNISFRYTRFINARKKRIGHLFQGRYKAVLVDADNHLLELVRYIHNNPVRAKIIETIDQYTWSSHRAYLGLDTVPWLSVEPVLLQFSKHEKTARKLYHEFVLRGAAEEHRAEFHRGTHEGRILGDDRFSEEALTRSEEEFRPEIRLQDVIGAVCEVYGIGEETLISAGKARPASEARAVAAMLVQDMGNLTLASLGRVLGRKIATLSKSANRAKERASRDKKFRKKIERVRRNIYRHEKA